MLECNNHKMKYTGTCLIPQKSQFLLAEFCVNRCGETETRSAHYDTRLMYCCYALTWSRFQSRSRVRSLINLCVNVIDILLQEVGVVKSTNRESTNWESTNRMVTVPDNVIITSPPFHSTDLWTEVVKVTMHGSPRSFSSSLSVI